MEKAADLTQDEMLEFEGDRAFAAAGTRGLLRHIGTPRLGARHPTERLLRVGSES
jgi:hypothetical protein